MIQATGICPPHAPHTIPYLPNCYALFINMVRKSRVMQNIMRFLFLIIYISFSDQDGFEKKTEWIKNTP